MATWERQLARVWRDAQVSGVTSEEFIARAKNVVESFSKTIFVFGYTSVNRFSIDAMPTEADVVQFYNNVVFRQTKVLSTLLADAGASSSRTRSGDVAC